MASTGEPSTIGARFETQPNALNFLRLCLALEVVVWHAYVLPGGTWLPVRVEHFLGDIGVDSFFAISGYLIVRAWCRWPDPARFLLARARRILPGLWACLAVTAFVIAPLSALIAGSAVPTLAGEWHYVAANAFVQVRQWGIDGSPGAGANPAAWNGSLWSLWFEVFCYAVVLGAGLLRLLRLPIVAGTTLAIWTLATMNGLPPLYSRTWLMFGCGATLYLAAQWVPASRLLAWASGTVIAFGAFALPGGLPYRLLAGPAVAYLCIYGGLILGHSRRLVLHHDLSYGAYVYAFPIQQALLVCGLSLGWVGFSALSVASVLPVAALSWFLVERPAMRARRQIPLGTVGSGSDSSVVVRCYAGSRERRSVVSDLIDPTRIRLRAAGDVAVDSDTEGG